MGYFSKESKKVKKVCMGKEHEQLNQEMASLDLNDQIDGK